MQTNSRIENPTRNASARAIARDFERASAPPSSRRIMKYKADPRLATIAMKAMTTKYVMGGIIP